MCVCVCVCVCVRVLGMRIECTLVYVDYTYAYPLENPVAGSDITLAVVQPGNSSINSSLVRLYGIRPTNRVDVGTSD